MVKLSRKNAFFSLITLILVAASVGVYFWQHSKVNTANKQTTTLKNQVQSLSSQNKSLSQTISKNAAKSNTSSLPTYKVGDTQCEKSLCITLVKVGSEPASSNAAGGVTQGDTLFAVTLTVTNNGNIPTITNSEEGIIDGSLIYTSDNLFVRPYPGNLGGMKSCTNPIFGNDIGSFPKTGQTVTGCVVFEIPPSVLVDTYLYGDLKWLM